MTYGVFVPRTQIGKLYADANLWQQKTIEAQAEQAQKQQKTIASQAEEIVALEARLSGIEARLVRLDTRQAAQLATPGND